MNRDYDNDELNIEKLSEEELDAYLKVIEEDTPDLWQRISAGYDQEMAMLRNENKPQNNVVSIDVARKQKAKQIKRTILAVAAVALIAIIAAPMVSSNKRDTKKDKSDKQEMVYQDEDQNAEQVTAAEPNNVSDGDMVEEVTTDDMMQVNDSAKEDLLDKYSVKSATVTYKEETSELSYDDIYKIIDIALNAQFSVCMVSVDATSDAIIFETEYNENDYLKVIINENGCYAYSSALNMTVELDESTAEKLSDLATEIISQ